MADKTAEARANLEAAASHIDKALECLPDLEVGKLPTVYEDVRGVRGTLQGAADHLRWLVSHGKQEGKG